MKLPVAAIESKIQTTNVIKQLKTVGKCLGYGRKKIRKMMKQGYNTKRYKIVNWHLKNTQHKHKLE